jgi:hypothetical protein
MVAANAGLSLARLLTPWLGSPYSGLLCPLINARISAGRKPFSSAGMPFSFHFLREPQPSPMVMLPAAFLLLGLGAQHEGSLDDHPLAGFEAREHGHLVAEIAPALHGPYLELAFALGEEDDPLAFHPL